MTRRSAKKEQRSAHIRVQILSFALFAAFGTFTVQAQRAHPNTRPAPPPVRPTPAPAPEIRGPVAPPQNMPRPQNAPQPQRLSPMQQPGHLGDWLRNHQSLNTEQQERALRQEPGFNHLPAETQQRVLKQFRDLNSMPPEQRQRKLEYLEAIERLSPAQKQQLQGAMNEVRTLPGDRQRVVRRALKDLRDIPPNQRQSVLESPRFDSLTPQERGILGSLIRVEP